MINTPYEDPLLEWVERVRRWRKALTLEVSILIFRSAAIVGVVVFIVAGWAWLWKFFPFGELAKYAVSGAIAAIVFGIIQGIMSGGE